MRKFEVRRLGYALGAEITGLDLTEPLDAETVSAIRRASLDHLVLCIRGQQLNPQQMIAFCERFGDVRPHSNPQEHHPENKAATLIVNKPTTVGGKLFPGSVSDEWHSDQVWSLSPPVLGFLNAQVLPSVGGDTMFANMYMAWETLSPALAKMIERLDAVFDITLAGSFQRFPPEKQADIRARTPPVIHSVVRVHPETGRKALNVSHRLRSFTGMTDEESRPLFHYLNSHATSYELSYRHRWAPHDLIMWDNRCTLHRAVADYDPSELRRMLRCETAGPVTGRPYDGDEARPLAAASPAS